MRLRLPGQGERGQAQRAARRTAPRSSSARPRSTRSTPTPTTSVSDRLVAEIDGAWKPEPVREPGQPASRTTCSTGPEIWEQTDGRITHFVAGIGTGGTITGTGRYLKEVSGGRVQVIGADPEGSVYSGGTGRPYLVEGVGEDFWPTTYDKDICDRIIAVSDADSFAMTRRLAREEALLVGGSCGMATVAALRVAAELTRRGPRRRGRRAAARRRAAATSARSSTTRGWRGYGFLPPAPGRHGRRRPAPQGRRDARRSCTRTRTRRSPTPCTTCASSHVSQMPVVRAEPPVMAAEVVGSVVERDLLDALFTGRAQLSRPARAAHVAAAADHRGERAARHGDDRRSPRPTPRWCWSTASPRAS